MTTFAFWRVSKISPLSNWSVYFFNDLNTTGFRIETPKSVYETLYEVDLGIDTDKLFSNIISFDALRGVAHSLQYLELEGLLVSHMGHLIAILALKKAWGKNNKESEKSQLKYRVYGCMLFHPVKETVAW